jgi:tRNA(fMet)-specific endonuclease VapC
VALILDTNALSAFADGDEALLAPLRKATGLFVPVIVLGEYRFGIAQSKRRKSYEEWLTDALRDMTVLPVLETTVDPYVRLCLALRKQGTPIPANDIWIAALAVEHELPILSRDEHFDVAPSVTRLGW